MVRDGQALSAKIQHFVAGFRPKRSHFGLFWHGSAQLGAILRVNLKNRIPDPQNRNFFRLTGGPTGKAHWAGVSRPRDSADSPVVWPGPRARSVRAAVHLEVHGCTLSEQHHCHNRHVTFARPNGAGPECNSADNFCDGHVESGRDTRQDPSLAAHSAPDELSCN